MAELHQPMHVIEKMSVRKLMVMAKMAAAMSGRKF
jgi:hypothetical protein